MQILHFISSILLHKLHPFVKLNLQLADQSCYQLVKKNHQTIEYSNEDVKKPVVHVMSTSEGYYKLLICYRSGKKSQTFNANIVLLFELK